MLCLADVSGEACSFFLEKQRRSASGVEGVIGRGNYGWNVLKTKKRKRKASASWKDTQQLGAGIIEDLDLVHSTHMVDYNHL